ncbi:hypothetical protein SAMN05444166_7404 [Singulisphaera sp. GP187]|nr:hypothetical protein SAMN05444166_7404 [Singulisphaera sp. GP187]
MPIPFACERCGKCYRVEDSAAGKRGTCKQCGHAFTIPTPLEPVEIPSTSDVIRPVAKCGGLHA